MLQRIRTLAVQSANGTNTKEDRQALQQEVDKLSAEITRIAKQTTFAGATVLDGANPTNTGGKSLIPGGANQGKITFQVGANAGDTLALAWSRAFTMSGLYSQVLGNNFQAGKGIAERKVDSQTAQYVWQVSTAETATQTLANIDAFIQKVDSKRSELGAIQNRMESTIRNQANISENEADARSRIRDTDFASETAALTQNNIIQQASQSVLAQANQRPTIALSLLGQ